jgi:hypothetical protein
MREGKVYGIVLIISVLGFLVVALAHPTGHQALSSPERLEQVIFVTVLVHGVALVSIALSLLGLVGLSHRLGISRVEVTAALIAFSLATVGVVCAALINGFVAPNLGRWMLSEGESVQSLVGPLFRYNAMLNRAFANFHVVSGSAAILAWSVSMIRIAFGRPAGWLGIVIALGTVVALLGGPLQMDVHGMAIVVLSQGVWMAWVGVLLIRTRGGSRDST